jgi:hypothetical protein
MGMKMKLAIVCGAPSSEMLAPWDDFHEIWVLGNRCDRYPRFDLIFEIHDNLEQHDPKYAQWLVDKNVPMIVGEAFPIEAEHVTTFPYAEANALFGSEYLTSSPAMMIALAILRDFKHIELYGVDMAVDDFEYFWQRPCVEAWIGFARGRGHDVILHRSSPVCRSSYVEGRASGGKPAFGKPPFTAEGFRGIGKRHWDIVGGCNDTISAQKLKRAAHEGAAQAYEQMGKVARAIEAGNEIDSLEVTVRPRGELERGVE